MIDTTLPSFVQDQTSELKASHRVNGVNGVNGTNSADSVDSV